KSGTRRLRRVPLFPGEGFTWFEGGSIMPTNYLRFDLDGDGTDDYIAQAGSAVPRFLSYSEGPTPGVSATPMVLAACSQAKENIVASQLGIVPPRVGDFNGDGLMDLVVHSGTTSNPIGIL